MDQSGRPYRSVLYIPASNARALDKARGLPADAIIFDLEDAVAADRKADARATLAKALGAGDFGGRARIVRINALSTPWGHDDVQAIARLAADAVLLPKVDGPQDLDALAALMPDTPIWAMMETPQGILNASPIAAHPQLRGMVLGTNDLAKELDSRARADRLPLLTSLQTCLLAARAYGLVCIDAVYNAFRDDTGLRAECEAGRDMGFDGKTLIHPGQLATANAVFAPGDDEIDLARRQIAAFDAAMADGKGVAVVDGRIVENLHIATAQATLDRAEAIAKLEISS